MEVQGEENVDKVIKTEENLLLQDFTKVKQSICFLRNKVNKENRFDKNCDSGLSKIRNHVRTIFSVLLLRENDNKIIDDFLINSIHHKSEHHKYRMNFAGRKRPNNEIESNEENKENEDVSKTNKNIEYE